MNRFYQRSCSRSRRDHSRNRPPAPQAYPTTQPSSSTPYPKRDEVPNLLALRGAPADWTVRRIIWSARHVLEPSISQSLIQELWLGEPDYLSALERVFERLRETLKHRACARLGNETQAYLVAEEALIVVTRKLLNDPKYFKDSDHLAGYLYSALYSKIADLHRRERKYFQPEDDETLQRIADEFHQRVSSEADGKELTQEEREQLIRDALNSLEPLDRVAVEMAYLWEYSSKQGGKALGIDPGTFRTRVSRAITKLRNWATGRKLQ